MRADYLIKILKLLPEDTEIYVQTVPNDFAKPIELSDMELWPATKDERGGTLIGVNREKLIITAHRPSKDQP